MRYRKFRRRVEVYPVLFWVAETVHFSFNGEEIEAPAWKFASEEAQRTIRGAVKEIPPPTMHPVQTVVISQIRGQTVLIRMVSAFTAWAVAGWEEIA